MSGLTGETLMVGMAEIKTICTPASTLTVLGLGSCVGVCIFDPRNGVAGMAHIVLPERVGSDTNPAKFADSAIPLLLQAMQEAGAQEFALRAVLIGGAQLFAGTARLPGLDIGPRNTLAVQRALTEHQVPIVSSDTGGTAGRTVHFHIDGRVRVKTIGQGEKLLACLSESHAPAPQEPVESTLRGLAQTASRMEDAKAAA